MKSPLFTRLGWFMVPCSIYGGVLYLLAAGFCATVFFAVDRHSHSVSDALYGIYPFFVPTFLLVDWIARRSTETHGGPPDSKLARPTPPAARGSAPSPEPKAGENWTR